MLTLKVPLWCLRGGLFHYICLNGLLIMTFSSTIQILKLNEVEKGKSAKTGKDWERHTAETMLLNDDGTIDVVGKLDIPPSLRGAVGVGTFRAGFSLQVPTFGSDQGKVVARLVSLQAAVVRKPEPAKAA